jgi:transposase-like protein
MKKQRQHYTSEEKVAILRRHLLEQVPISELCDELGLQPTRTERSPMASFRRRQTLRIELASINVPNSPDLQR